MAILKQYRCAAHGEMEMYAPICQFCGHGAFVKQEIRTAPAFRRKNMKFIDGTLRQIADDHGLTNLKNDPKGGVSVLQALTKTNDVNKPRWIGVDHAAPGFSRTPDAKVPKVTAESMGFMTTSAKDFKVPTPKTQIVAGWKGD
jgi:hypothetical protein